MSTYVLTLGIDARLGHWTSWRIGPLPITRTMRPGTKEKVEEAIVRWLKNFTMRGLEPSDLVNVQLVHGYTRRQVLLEAPVPLQDVLGRCWGLMEGHHMESAIKKTKRPERAEFLAPKDDGRI